jgi:hypothetical protein
MKIVKALQTININHTTGVVRLIEGKEYSLEDAQADELIRAGYAVISRKRARSESTKSVPAPRKKGLSTKDTK